MSDYQKSVSIGDLGYFLDGWAEIIEGMGEKAEAVHDSVNTNLKAHEMPGVSIVEVLGSAKLTMPADRDYILNEMAPGVTSAIYIAKHGVDLYVSWRTFIKSVLNMQVVWIVLGASAILGLFVGGIDRGYDFYGNTATTFSFGGWIGWTIGFIVLAILFLSGLGKFIKGNSLTYFFIEPTIFDAEDITALSLSVHKTILRSLDHVGIDSSKLRIKQSFKGGRRGEDL